MHHINGAVLVPAVVIISCGLVKLFSWLDKRDRRLLAEVGTRKPPVQRVIRQSRIWDDCE